MSVPRSARDIAKTDACVLLRRKRKKVEMLFAQSNTSTGWFDCDYEVPGARDEFHMAAPHRTSENWQR